MKEGWEIRKLGSLCSINRDSGIHSEMPYLGMENIGSGNGKVISEGDISSVVGTTNLFQKGDVLYGKLRPYLKKVVVAEYNGCCSTEIIPLKCNCRLHPVYLKYWFLEDSISDRINATCGGCRMPRANMKDVFQFDIPITTLSEQQRIVDILDAEFEKIDRLRSNAELNLQHAKDLFQAALKEELEPKEGWQTRRVGDTFEITDFVSNGSFASLRENVKYYDEPNYAVLIRLADNSSGFNPERFVYIDEHGYDYLSKSKLFGGELIMCNIGATVGTTFICPNLGKPMSIGPNSLLIRTPNNQFFNYYLQNPSFKKKLRGIISKTTLEKFNKTQFKELTITFPSAQECNSIVATLDDLNAKCKVLQDNYTKTIALCDDLKQALLRKAFNGEL